MLSDPHPEFAPAILLGALLAVGCTLVFALLGGRRAIALFALLPFSAVGVFLGQSIGERFGLTGVLIGDLRLLDAAVAAWVLLLFAKRLGL